ncbi:MAG TPA: hypothetical protein VMM93_08930 [Vicinamibacterales bacterium]|nr:hypothetical protein [Vicinamibacterales bacterium]
MIRSCGRPLVLAGLLVVAGSLACASGQQAEPGRPDLPDRLTSEQFWTLSQSLSEPPGYFRSENLVSNENTYQYILPALVERVQPGGVYLGVAPDQNFTYIAAVRPAMAFIVDVRRGNLLQHLMYKALFELSADRGEFVSRLFSRRRPADLGPASGVSDIFGAFARVSPDDDLYRTNLAALKARLVDHHGFDLSPADLQQLESIYFSFFWEGPNLRYSVGRFGQGGRMAWRSSFPTYEEMVLQSDWTGEQRSYLATEALYQSIRTMQQRNLVVPVMGNFAGPTALRAVGEWIRERRAVVSAFYVSNVEQYLFQDGLFEAFAANVATLPVGPSSTFIRSVSGRFGYRGPMQWHDLRATALYPIVGFIKDVESGSLRSYFDLNARSSW